MCLELGRTLRAVCCGAAGLGTQRRWHQGFGELLALLARQPLAAAVCRRLPPAFLCRRLIYVAVYSIGAKAAGNGKVSSLESAGQDAVLQPRGRMVYGRVAARRAWGGERAGQQHGDCGRTVQSCGAGNVIAAAVVGRTLQFTEGTFLRITADNFSNNVWHRVAAGGNATRCHDGMR